MQYSGPSMSQNTLNTFTELKGQYALVLGASSGFGESACRRFAEAGMNIIGVHLDRKAGMAHVEQLKSDLEKWGVKALFFNMNAADAEKRAEVIAEIKNLTGARIKVLLHSLAFGALKPLLAPTPTDVLSKAQIEMTLDVMASSLVYWAQDLSFAELWAPRSRIFAMTSAGSSRVWKSYGAVSAAKASLESYIRQLALELGDKGHTANAILAGVTDTPALRKIPGNEEMIQTAQKRNPMGRLTTPDDVARSLLAFCLSNFDFMTGNTIRIDGGENIVD
jgi:enoyl-[acyl-carrier protein] reductase III